MACGRVTGGGGDARGWRPPLLDRGEKRREGVLPLPDDDVIGVLRNLPVTGGGMGAADDGYAVRSFDLATVYPLRYGVQAVAGDVGAGLLRRLKVVAVYLARCGERGEGVAC